MPILKNNTPPPKILISASGKNARRCVSIRPKFQRNDSIFTTIIYFLIVMLILICFCTYAAREKRLHGLLVDLVNLPVADGITEKFNPNNSMLVTIMRDGSLYFNEDRIDNTKKIEALITNIEKDKKKENKQMESGDDVILLRYDKDAPSSLIFEVFSIAGKLKKQVFIITDSPQQATSDFADGKQ